MTQVIFAVEKPKADTVENERRWRGCTTNLLAQANKNTDIQILGENVLLISLDKDLYGLAKVIEEILGLGYRYQVLNEDIKWTEVPNKG